MGELGMGEAGRWEIRSDWNLRERGSQETSINLGVAFGCWVTEAGV